MMMLLPVIVFALFPMAVFSSVPNQAPNVDIFELVNTNQVERLGKILAKFPELVQEMTDSCFRLAVRHRRFDMVKFLLNVNSNLSDKCLSQSVVSVATSEDYILLDFLLNHYRITTLHEKVLFGPMLKDKIDGAVRIYADPRCPVDMYAADFGKIQFQLVKSCKTGSLTIDQVKASAGLSRHTIISLLRCCASSDQITLLSELLKTTDFTVAELDGVLGCAIRFGQYDLIRAVMSYFKFSYQKVLIEGKLSDEVREITLHLRRSSAFNLNKLINAFFNVWKMMLVIPQFINEDIAWLIFYHIVLTH